MPGGRTKSGAKPARLGGPGVASRMREPASPIARSCVKVKTRGVSGEPLASSKTSTAGPRVPPPSERSCCPAASMRSWTNWTESSPCQLPSTSSIAIRWFTASAGDAARRTSARVPSGRSGVLEDLERVRAREVLLDPVGRLDRIHVPVGGAHGEQLDEGEAPALELDAEGLAQDALRPRDGGRCVHRAARDVGRAVHLGD